MATNIRIPNATTFVCGSHLACTPSPTHGAHSNPLKSFSDRDYFWKYTNSLGAVASVWKLLLWESKNLWWRSCNRSEPCSLWFSDAFEDFAFLLAPKSSCYFPATSLWETGFWAESICWWGFSIITRDSMLLASSCSNLFPLRGTDDWLRGVFC